MTFQPLAPTPAGPAGPAAGPSPATGRPSRTSPLAHLPMAVLGLLSIFPVYWMYASSLRRPGDVYSQSPLPWPIDLANYQHVVHLLPIAPLFFNTLAMAAFTTAAQLLVCLLAGYAFAAWRFRGERLLFVAFVGVWLVPFQVTMIPNYLLLSQFGLLNTIAGVVVPNVCSALAVLLLRQHMQAFPQELLEASRMDGRSSWGTLWTVVVPNLRPALASLGILLFISAWNDYFWPALVLPRANSVIQLGIRSFLTDEGNDWGAVMAASGLACLPIFALYLTLQRQVVNAFVRSGLK